MVSLIYTGIIIAAIICVCLEILFRVFGLGTPWNIDPYGNRQSLHSRKISDRAPRIVSVGDSLTFGTRLKEQYSYPSKLHDKLQKHLKSSVDVRNAGISGHTSIQVLERLERDVIKFHPDIAVVWVGTNDGILKEHSDSPAKRPFDKPPILTKSVLLSTIYSWENMMPIINSISNINCETTNLTPRVSIDEFQRTLTEIFSRLELAGITHIIAINIPPISNDFMNYPIELVKHQRAVHLKYNEVISLIARSSGVTVIDSANVLRNGLKRMLLKDGLHLTPHGYEAIAEAVFHELTSGLYDIRPNKLI